jgi:hypothetical protein
VAALYSKAAEVEDIVRRLIGDHYQELAFNHEVQIICRFETPTREKNGKAILGECRKVSGLNSYLYRTGIDDTPEAKPFFLILISEDAWRVLNPDQREALVDHELAHVGADIDDKGNTVFSIKPHDIEEFRDVVARHGMYLADIERFIEAARPHFDITLSHTPSMFDSAEDDEEAAA